MFLADFGKKVRKIRTEKKITREDFCGDESELSVRQLARIEAGQCVPNLNKVVYISEQLQVSIGELTDGKSLELPNRYKDLKYLILQTSTYMDKERLRLREEQFDEIFEDYYDQLPEEEQLIIDMIQSRFDVYNSGKIDFGLGVLGEYFEQVKRKSHYDMNDFILIDLYLLCASISDFDSLVFDEMTFDTFVSHVLARKTSLPIKECFILNNVLISMIDIALRLKKYRLIEELFHYNYQIIQESQNFQKMSIHYMLLWKYTLTHANKKEEAESYYQQSLLFANMMNDTVLAEGLEREWATDIGR